MQPLKETLIDYHNPIINGTVKWLQASPQTDQHSLLITDQTCFHPLDYQWPDQPGDRGTLSWQGRSFEIVDSYIAAFNPHTAELYWHDQIPVKRGEDPWIFCVAHQLPVPCANLPFSPGDPLTLKIDAAYRNALSLAHSSCHLMSLALNRSLIPYWKKSIISDAFGSPDFDRLAIQQSTISPYLSTDQYRLGKSLRKKGFDKASFLDNLSNVQSAVNQQLHAWLQSPQVIVVSPAQGALLSRKSWQTQLDQQTVSIACGGTHCDNLSQLSSLHVTLHIEDSGNTLVARSALAIN